jgi:SNF2 family DNA or RNA helicase
LGVFTSKIGSKEPGKSTEAYGADSLVIEVSMQETPFLSTDLKKAESYLREGAAKALLFSEGTYQIEIFDLEKKLVFWPFLQLDDAGKVLDCFCTCPQAEKKKSCVHLAAAYLEIFNHKLEPLHVRFRESLWHQLCQVASRRHGYEPECLKAKESQRYEASSSTGKLLFYIHSLTPKGEKRLKEILFQRSVETEETSLKFSNLSQEELLLWKTGRPSHRLQFELSFWSDLAKWWMLLQEGEEEYQINFDVQQPSSKMPKWMHLRFKDIEAGFYIAETNWAELIPALATVKAPLAVYEFPHQVIRKITYLEKEQKLLLDITPLSPEKTEIDKEGKKAVQLGDWLYSPSKGFYPKRIDALLQEKEIGKEKIAVLLHKHAKIVRKYLQGTRIFQDPVKPNYLLEMTSRGDLEIDAYLFEPGDLQKRYSAYFGSWVYVEGRGFYLLENLLFPGVEKIIPKEKLSDFINRHRHWLNHYEGFQTHVSGFEAHITYHVGLDGSLRFDTQLEVIEEVGEVIDLGEWIYLRGRGFYAKTSSRSGLVLKPGLVIPAHEVSSFIHAYRDELEQVKGFFTAFCPLEKVSLSLSLNERERIVVTPEYHFKSLEAGKDVQIFGDFTYLPGEGFSEISPDMRLPSAYGEVTEIDPLIEPYFIAYELDLLKPHISSTDPRIAKPSSLYLKIEQVKRDLRSKAGGWLFTLEYETDVGNVSAFSIWQALNANKQILFSPAGLIILKQPRFNWLKAISKKRWSKQGKQIRLTTLEWLRLSIFEEVKEPEEEKSRTLLEELKNFQAQTPIVLAGLQSHLRNYQEVGVRWLWFLYTQGLSGLLCDEMGLGKTHQAMGLIASALNEAGGKKIKILVVCPTSVIFHWEELLKRFLPALRILVFYGSARTLESFQGDCDLLLTSYGTLRSEKQMLARLFFEIAIFDEIQIAKNAHSQTHKALRKIDAKMRLGLTGTPIENRLLELKALFDLVLPTYLPSEALFKSLFITPIEKYQDAGKKQLLARLIKPFILRRKKTEVLLELPSKTEEISYCSLSEEQKQLYQTTVAASKEALLKELKIEAHPIPYMHIFALLSALKQICDHPVLISKQFEHFQRHASGKWDLFIELLAEARDSGQKVVVFSQYLDMLDLIETYLTEKKIGYAGIRGSTRDRKRQVDRFREDPECEVFVASLQAAGVGIDLVAASVVIHYDRWWNPAKENQATDRVHRIGQSRGVQVFKLVTKGTIEEHIHRLIERKKTLVEGVLLYDDQDQVKHFTRADLIELLQLMSPENP